MSDVNARDTKLIQYLNEAYAKEKELEVSLAAHIAMTTATERKAYKKKLQEHLKETRSHSKQLERRVKKLGGSPGVLDSPREAVATSVGKAAAVAKAQVASAKGPLHALRGTGEEEKLLKNAKTEYFSEHEEIATYTAILTMAESVGDAETAKLARSIRRDEEKMARYLERLIPALTKAVVKAEVPAAERRKPSRRSRTTAAPKPAQKASAKAKASSRKVKAKDKSAKPKSTTSAKPKSRARAKAKA
ncbi:hypothetical protein BH10ACT11_BH10ACT11_13050 [soil metagenome]